MMKKIILAITLMFGGIAFVNAQQQTDTTSTKQSDQYRTESPTSDSTTTESTTPTESTTTPMPTEQTPTTPPTTDDQSSVTPADQDQEGEKIEISELPAAIQTKLQSTDYQGWVVSSARKKMWKDPADTQATEKEVYVIEAKNGSDTKKLKFDKDGNEIEHNKDKKDDQK